MTAPLSTVSNGRGKDGRFTRGNPGGPGRPRGLDFQQEVLKRAKSSDFDVADALWQVFLALLKKAKRGDVPAAKLLLDRLCDNASDTVEVTYRSLSNEERAARIKEILLAAKERRDQSN